MALRAQVMQSKEDIGTQAFPQISHSILKVGSIVGIVALNKIYQ